MVLNGATKDEDFLPKGTAGSEEIHDCGPALMPVSGWQEESLPEPFLFSSDDDGDADEEDNFDDMDDDFEDEDYEDDDFEDEDDDYEDEDDDFDYEEDVDYDDFDE